MYIKIQLGYTGKFHKQPVPEVTYKAVKEVIEKMLIESGLLNGGSITIEGE